MDKSTNPINWKEITTVEKAFEVEGLDITKIPDVSMLPPQFQKAVLAHFILMVCAKAVRGNWVPDWTNSRQWKYYPWFDMRSGSGLSYDGYAYVYSASNVGSRLCFETSEQAEFFGKTFIAQYEDLFLIKE